MHTHCRAPAVAALTTGRSLAIAFLMFTAAAAARADVVWSEGVQGDLSNDRLNPTLITLSLGANSISATSVFGDREYFTFALAPGQQLTAINHVSYDGLDETAFIAVQNGSVFTEPPTGTVVGNLLGWAHFGTILGTVGTDILDDMGTGIGAIGFTPPLPDGPYAFWMQQTGENASTYQFDFIVVPATSGLTCAVVPALICPHKPATPRLTPSVVVKPPWARHGRSAL